MSSNCVALPAREDELEVRVESPTECRKTGNRVKFGMKYRLDLQESLWVFST
jgi:hypothetical protein